MILPGIVRLTYKSLQHLDQLLHQKVSARVDGNCCTGLFATNSGICSSLVLIGVDDADEHGVLGVNTGHRQNSALHSLHTCFSMSREIWICLKAASKSKLPPPLNKSIVTGTYVVLYSRLWHEAPVDCECAFRMVDCPRVWSTVHFQIAHLLHFAVKIAVVQDLCMHYCARGVM